MKTLINFIALLIFTASVFSKIASDNTKYNKWLTPSYFRGYNVIYETPKTLQDFIDFKNYGGNLFSINTRGFLGEDAPYAINPVNIAATDELVVFCRQAHLHYVIAVRSGPGAYDTYFESIGQTPESRIWFTGNILEQMLYADMLKMIIGRYSDDSLFVGINLVIEPRPKVRSIQANTSKLYKIHLERDYDIHMDQVYQLFADQIRSSYADIPILLENFAYSTPELFPPYEINDPYVIYSTHVYQPNDYTKRLVPFSAPYPGIYLNITFLDKVLHDSTFMANIILGRVNTFQQTVNKPIFVGEFGMATPQIGGHNYIKDVLGTAKNRGWHFALWEWRGRRTGNAWSIEEFFEPENLHWKAVLKQFHAPPVPSLISPINDTIIQTLTPTFIWDSLTSFTKYDLRIFDQNGIIVASFEDIQNSRITYTGPPLQPGAAYKWQVRSKNPGGTQENNSAWSEEKGFGVLFLISVSNNNNEIPDKFELLQNYPNPFNPTTMIKYKIAKNTNVVMRIYDVNGRLINEVVNEYKHAGTYYFEFNATTLSSGVYYYKITTDYFTDAKKMLLVK